MDTTRRRFLSLSTVLIAAPAVIRLIQIMPIRAIPPVLHCNGVDCDADALEALMNGKPYHISERAAASGLSITEDNGRTYVKDGCFYVGRPIDAYDRSGPVNIVSNWYSTVAWQPAEAGFLLRSA